MRLTHLSYLRLALPFVLASITTPLLGAVGAAAVGRLGNVDYINAVALGAVIFSTIYWLFGFLRLITSSFSSQALGRGSREDALVALVQPALVALTVGLAVVAGQGLIWRGAMWILNPAPELRALCLVYFDILIWCAPLVLLTYVLLGWLMGQMRMKAVVALQVGTNLANCLLCFTLVKFAGLDVDGVALATLLAQAGSFCIALVLVLRMASFRNTPGLRAGLLDKKRFGALLSTNFYLMIRTICMLVMVNTFMSRSAAFGGELMAANAILFQLQYVMGDIFDGLSSASSVYSGVAVGKRDTGLFRADLRYSGIWSAIFALGMSALYYLLHAPILALFTDNREVLRLAAEYSVYIVLFPPIAAAGIVYYGIFNGALKTRMVCQSMLLTVAAYLPALYLLAPSPSAIGRAAGQGDVAGPGAVAAQDPAAGALGTFGGGAPEPEAAGGLMDGLLAWLPDPGLGNHGLWLAYIVFYVGRSGFLMMFLPRLIRALRFA